VVPRSQSHDSFWLRRSTTPRRLCLLARCQQYGHPAQNGGSVLSATVAQCCHFPGLGRPERFGFRCFDVPTRWSKYSCGTLIVFEESAPARCHDGAKCFLPLDRRPAGPGWLALRRGDRTPHQSFHAPCAPAELPPRAARSGVLDTAGTASHRTLGRRAFDTKPASCRAGQHQQPPQALGVPGAFRSPPASLRVGEPESGGQLGAKNPVFRREVRISQKEFLVDRSRDISQQSKPSTVSHRDQSYTIYVS
jgi:hypothetical protein